MHMANEFLHPDGQEGHRLSKVISGTMPPACAARPAVRRWLPTAAPATATTAAADYGTP